MDGRRMTGPEPWMASTDDAMEAETRCRGFRFKCSEFSLARGKGLQDRSGVAGHHRSMERSDTGPKRMAQRRPRKAARTTLLRERSRLGLNRDCTF